MFAEPYAKHYELLNSKKPYKEEIEFVWTWGHKPKTVLDLGCGTAHYWKYWPEGVEVIGVERSKDMIAASQHRNRIVCEDVTEIGRKFWPGQVELVTALFDVVNYIPDLSWIERLPVKSGGFFIFDVLNPKGEKFKKTEREAAGIKRVIEPVKQTSKKVTLAVSIQEDPSSWRIIENHTLYLWTEKDIEKAASSFEIAEVKPTGTWQTWYKLIKK